MLKQRKNLIKMFKKLKIITGLIYLITLASLVYGYKVEDPAVVHQHISKEASEVWGLMPYEVKENLNNSIYTDITDLWFWDFGYNNGDDIIDGSGEEDKAWCLFSGASSCPYYHHFFDPDDPNAKWDFDPADYNHGWENLPTAQSSYRKALEYWETKVIPLYLKGEKEKSYYWLGRIAHLLEDATVPAHVHDDTHFDGTPEGLPGDDSLEVYTGDNWSNYDGSDYSGGQYDYDALPNMAGFDWSSVEPSNKQNIELFRLFWYTAQKTQYFASDDEDGNSNYTDLDDNSHAFSTSLWTGDGVTIIDKNEYLVQDDITNSGPNITKVANATIPHAMKATAGLYRLFWDAVHIDWPTDHHDNRRTSFTLLKGDMDDSDIDGRHFVLQPTSVDASEYVSRPTVAYVDDDDYMDVVVSSAIETGAEGYLYLLEYEDKPYWNTNIYPRWWRKWKQKWKIPVSPMIGPFTLADIYSFGGSYL